MEQAALLDVASTHKLYGIAGTSPAGSAACASGSAAPHGAGAGDDEVVALSSQESEVTANTKHKNKETKKGSLQGGCLKKAKCIHM